MDIFLLSLHDIQLIQLACALGGFALGAIVVAFIVWIGRDFICNAKNGD